MWEEYQCTSLHSWCHVSISLNHNFTPYLWKETSAEQIKTMQMQHFFKRTSSSKSKVTLSDVSVSHVKLIPVRWLSFWIWTLTNMLFKSVFDNELMIYLNQWDKMWSFNSSYLWNKMLTLIYNFINQLFAKLHWYVYICVFVRVQHILKIFLIQQSVSLWCSMFSGAEVYYSYSVGPRNCQAFN